jgi:hypothetical protein
VYIKRHFFVEQDSRPLYSWPERDSDGRSNRKLRIRQEIQRLIELEQKKENDAASIGSESYAEGDGDEDKSVS